MKKFSYLVLLLFSTALLAQDKQTFRYIGGTDCFVKRYHNKELEIVPESTIKELDLITAELKRNPQYRAFKVKGELHITPKDCLKASGDAFDELENYALNNEPREKTLKEVIQEEKRSRSAPINTGSRRAKYFIELGAGLVNVSSQENIFPFYKRDLDPTIGQTDTDGNHIDSITYPAGSKYKTSPSLLVGFGIKTDSYYWMFRLKRYTAKKNENVDVQITDNTATTYIGTIDTKFADTTTNLLTGIKYHFNNSSGFKTYAIGALGISILDSTFSYLAVVNNELDLKDYKLESTALALDLSVGGELFLSKSIALNLEFGYEFLTHKQLRVKDSNSSSGVSNDGFNTGMKYSNIFAQSGLIFYF